MNIPRDVHSKEKDKYIQPFINEGEKAKALFATGNHQEKKRWTVEEYLIAVDDPLLSENRTDSKQKKGRFQLLREGESKTQYLERRNKELSELATEMYTSSK